jgi:hypothetical protein
VRLDSAGAHEYSPTRSPGGTPGLLARPPPNRGGRIEPRPSWRIGDLVLPVREASRSDCESMTHRAPSIHPASKYTSRGEKCSREFSSTPKNSGVFFPVAEIS